MVMTVRVCGSLDHGECAPREDFKKNETSVTFKITVDLIAHRIALHQYG